MKSKYGLKFSECEYGYEDKYFCYDEGIHYTGFDVSEINMFDSKESAKNYLSDMMKYRLYSADLKGYSKAEVIRIEFHENVYEKIDLNF